METQTINSQAGPLHAVWMYLDDDMQLNADEYRLLGHYRTCALSHQFIEPLSTTALLCKMPENRAREARQGLVDKHRISFTVQSGSQVIITLIDPREVVFVASDGKITIGEKDTPTPLSNSEGVQVALPKNGHTPTDTPPEIERGKDSRASIGARAELESLFQSPESVPDSHTVNSNELTQGGLVSQLTNPVAPVPEVNPAAAARAAALLGKPPMVLAESLVALKIKFTDALADRHDLTPLAALTRLYELRRLMVGHYESATWLDFMRAIEPRMNELGPHEALDALFNLATLLEDPKPDTVYTYLMINRPAGYATCPDGRIVPLDKPHVPDQVIPDYGTVSYSRKLTAEDLARFEMAPQSDNAFEFQPGARVLVNDCDPATVIGLVYRGRYDVRYDSTGAETIVSPQQVKALVEPALAVQPDPIPDPVYYKHQARYFWTGTHWIRHQMYTRKGTKKTRCGKACEVDTGWHFNTLNYKGAVVDCPKCADLAAKSQPPPVEPLFEAIALFLGYDTPEKRQVGAGHVVKVKAAVFKYRGLPTCQADPVKCQELADKFPRFTADWEANHPTGFNRPTADHKVAQAFWDWYDADLKSAFNNADYLAAARANQAVERQMAGR